MRDGEMRTADGRREGLLALLTNLQRDEGHCDWGRAGCVGWSDVVVCAAEVVVGGMYRDRGPGHSLCTVHSRVPPKAPTIRFSVSLRGNRLFPSTTEAANGVSGGKSRVFGIIFFGSDRVYVTGAKGRRPRSPVDLERCRSRRCGRVGRRARLVSRAVGAWSRAGPCATVPT